MEEASIVPRGWDCGMRYLEDAAAPILGMEFLGCRGRYCGRFAADALWLPWMEA
jgi:hypothetical protein